MSFIGTVGVVAQQGNQVVSSAPENVAISTSSSGNYEGSFLTDDTGSSFQSLTTDGSNTKLGQTNEVTKEVYDAEYGGGGGSSSYIKCYMRAQNATSFSMSAISLNSSLSGGCTLSGAGTGWGVGTFTSQDGTGSTGIAYFNINHGGGRGSVVTPSLGDTFEISVSGSATNSAGTTNATTITGDFEFVG